MLSLRTRGVIASLIMSMVAACAATDGARERISGPFARLTAVLVDDRPAGPGGITTVTVLRDGAPVSPAAGLPLQKGDEIATGPATFVEITFASGEEAILWPETRVVILNPSLREIVGKVAAIISDVVQAAADLEDRFAVKTEYVTAGASSTAWQVAAESNDNAHVIVLDGVVELASNEDLWGPVQLGRFQAARMDGRAPPDVGFADPEAFNDIVRTINRFARLTETERRADVLTPVVAGLPETEARRVLTMLELGVGRRYGVVTGQAASGVVIDQSPPPGAPMEPGGAVDLGVETASVVVPTILSLPGERAEAALRDQGLGIGEVTREFQEGAVAGSVIAQEPSPGDRVPRGMVVDFVTAVDQRTYCAENAGVAPTSGEVLSQNRRGPNELQAINGTPHDAIVKLREPGGRSVLAFYVAASSEAEIGGVPNGAYRLAWLTGDRYSRACGRFLQNMSASQSEDVVQLRDGRLGFTLHPVAGGTMQLEGIGVDEFLRD